MMTTPDHTRRHFELHEAIALLSRTPAMLDIWLRELPDGWLAASEGPATWNPFDVVGHLIHADRTDWMARARRVLDHGESVPFDALDRFAQFRESAGKTIAQLLDEFADVRAENLRQLAAWRLDAAALARTGLHPALGPVQLQHLLSAWVAHDLDHISQIARVMARQYTDAVGPWKAYLRVIRDVRA
jgi:hypothetical protein